MMHPSRILMCAILRYLRNEQPISRIYRCHTQFAPTVFFLLCESMIKVWLLMTDDSNDVLIRSLIEADYRLFLMVKTIT